MKIRWKKVATIAITVIFLSVLVVWLSNLWVVISTQNRVLSDYRHLPDSGVALVLGTSHKLISGQPNPFFQNRINTAAELYKQGKIVHFILSGDNRTRYYNEPLEMRKALIKQGYPCRPLRWITQAFARSTLLCVARKFSAKQTLRLLRSRFIATGPCLSAITTR